MAITEELLSQDEYFLRTTGDKIIVNDLNYFSVDDIDSVTNSLMTIYDSDVISTTPSCDCGRFNTRDRLGRTCPNCGTTCRDPFEKTEPLLWLKSFDPSIKLMNPIFWLMLKRLLHNKYDYVRWMCDNKYNPPVKLPLHVIGLREVLGNVRTYDNMVEKIPNVLRYLSTHSKYKDPDHQLDIEILLEMYRTKSGAIFSNHLSIVNKQLFVMMNSNKGKFTNLMVADVIDSVMLWIKTASVDTRDLKKYNQVTGVVMSKLAEMYQDYLKEYVASKHGALRKHIYGARSHFTFRNVITATTGPHMHYHIDVPWVTGIVVFRPHLLNKLMNKYGYAYKKANKLLNSAAKRYVEIINVIFKELIAESSDPRGIPILAHRNPTLLQSSFLLVYLHSFHTDLGRLSTSISPQIIKFPNGDSTQQRF